VKPEDRAQELELIEWEGRQKQAILPPPIKESAKRCVAPGCGQRISKARQKAVPGVQFCVECQEYNEFMGKKYASAN
jgi:RNA polymerase-binding transcription factor DksA